MQAWNAIHAQYLKFAYNLKNVQTGQESIVLLGVI